MYVIRASQTPIPPAITAAISRPAVASTEDPAGPRRRDKSGEVRPECEAAEPLVVQGGAHHDQQRRAEQDDPADVVARYVAEDAGSAVHEQERECQARREREERMSKRASITPATTSVATSITTHEPETHS